MISLGHDEKVIIVIRRHWLPLLLRGLALAGGALLPFVLAAVVPPEVFAPLAAYPGGGLVLMFFYSLWLLVLWITFFVSWTNYYFDAWVLTNERIIDIDQVGLFRRHMVSAELDKIQDAHVEVEGLLPTFFGYGRLVLYTAGEHPDIVIDSAAHPYAAKERILGATRAVRAGAGEAGGV